MKNNSLVLALFLGSVQSTSLRFLDAGSGEASLEQKDIDYLADHSTMNFNFLQIDQEAAYHPDDSVFALAAAKEGSGVRARWIELPDCGATGKLDQKIPIFDQEIIPLDPDLHNAAIATCKAYTPDLKKKGDKMKDTIEAIGPTLGGDGDKKEKKQKPLIYDEVMHISGQPASDMETHNHQVPVQMEGEVDPKPTAGPRGDFDYKGLQQAPTEWVKPAEEPAKDVLMGFNSDPINLNQSKWVEIPDCKGLAKEVALKEDLDNAVFATCKQRPGVAPVPESYKYPTKQL